MATIQMETVMQSEMYLVDDINRILEELTTKGTWAQNEAARSLLAELQKAPRFVMSMMREAK